MYYYSKYKKYIYNIFEFISNQNIPNNNWDQILLTTKYDLCKHLNLNDNSVIKANEKVLCHNFVDRKLKIKKKEQNSEFNVWLLIRSVLL